MACAAAAAQRRKSVTITLKPGTYEWYCSIGNHKAMGMVGRLVVK